MAQHKNKTLSINGVDVSFTDIEEVGDALIRALEVATINGKKSTAYGVCRHDLQTLLADIAQSKGHIYALTILRYFNGELPQAKIE